MLLPPARAQLCPDSAASLRANGCAGGAESRLTAARPAVKFCAAPGLLTQCVRVG